MEELWVWRALTVIFVVATFLMQYGYDGQIRILNGIIDDQMEDAKRWDDTCRRYLSIISKYRESHAKIGGGFCDCPECNFAALEVGENDGL